MMAFSGNFSLGKRISLTARPTRHALDPFSVARMPLTSSSQVGLCQSSCYSVRTVLPSRQTCSTASIICDISLLF